MLELCIQMHKPENGKLPVLGHKTLVITTNAQECMATRIKDDIWQNLLTGERHRPIRGKFNTVDVYAWGYLESREWRNDND